MVTQDKFRFGPVDTCGRRILAENSSCFYSERSNFARREQRPHQERE
jgi:hypothetical protein